MSKDDVTTEDEQTPVHRLVIRLPQRFQWKDRFDLPWRNGIVFPAVFSDDWHIRAGGFFADFESDPWEIMGQVIGDAAAFRWIDNDYEWEPKGAICCDTTYETAEDFRAHLRQCHQCG